MNGLLLVAFAIRDAKAEMWQRPFFAQKVGPVIRELIGAVNDPQHDYGKYAEDFSLWELGTFDPVAGKLEAHPAAVPVCQLVTLKREARPQIVKEA